MLISSLPLGMIISAQVDHDFHKMKEFDMFLKNKMNAFLGLIFLSAVPFLSAHADTKGTASAVPATAGLQVAVIDVQSAILQTEEGKSAKSKLEKEVTQKRHELTKQEAQLKKMQEDFQAQQAVLSEADKQARSKEFQTKLQAFQQSQMTFEQEARQKEAAALQKIFLNIQAEISKLAKQKNYDMVFDKSAAVLLYAKNTTDVTAEVVGMYNKDYKVKDKK